MFGHLKVLERDTSKPRGADAYWICQCDKCESLCSIRSHDLLSGKTRTCGCGLSKGEDKIIEILKSLKVVFVSQKTFSDLRGEVYPLRFDFFLPDYNLLIEYQGKQHYSAQEYFGGEERFNQQQEYDNKKKEYCLQNDLNLIEIPYWDYDNLDEQYIQDKLNDLKLKEKNNA